MQTATDRLVDILVGRVAFNIPLLDMIARYGAYLLGLLVGIHMLLKKDSKLRGTLASFKGLIWQGVALLMGAYIGQIFGTAGAMMGGLGGMLLIFLSALLGYILLALMIVTAFSLIAMGLDILQKKSVKELIDEIKTSIAGIKIKI